MAGNEYYDSYWSKQTDALKNYASWKRKILENLLPEGSDVLDLGCGDMSSTMGLAGSSRITGIDISGKALELSKERGGRRMLLDLDRSGIPFGDESFDFVLLLDVLEHLINPGRVIEEAARTLRKGGCIVCSVPNSMNIINRIYFAMGEPRDITNADEKAAFPEHIRLFSKSRLEGAFSGMGLVKAESHFYFPGRIEKKKWLGFPSSLVRSLRLHERFPSLFSLSFLYVFRKTGDVNENPENH